MILIGTAGHIDHGKTTLLQALTGINPSRLPEEKKREMTIDLGYAWIKHPDGYKLGFIDVPGHERLIRNMAAGATSMRAALLVVDAGEGVREQTLEHFRILELLGVECIIPVITKSKTADSNQIQKTVEGIEELLSGTRYTGSNIFKVDSILNSGLNELKQEIFRISSGNNPSDIDETPYLSVDRSFQLKGIGTVVTGSLIKGTLQKGQQVKLSCFKDPVKIRSIHNHNDLVDKITAGHRAGLQLPGTLPREIKRGTAIVDPVNHFSSPKINADLHLLKDSPVKIKSGNTYLFYSGCMEYTCLIWVGIDKKTKFSEEASQKAFSSKTQDPGTSAWVQIVLDQDIHVYRGQRFIIRSTNPLVTIAGGELIDCRPCVHRKILGSEIKAYLKKDDNSKSLEAAQFLSDGPEPFYSLNNLSQKFIRPKDVIKRTLCSLPDTINEQGPDNWDKAVYTASLPRLEEHLKNLPAYIKNNLSEFQNGMFVRQAADYFKIPEGLFHFCISSLSTKGLNLNIGSGRASLIIEKDKLYLRGITIEADPEIKKVMVEILSRLDKEGNSTTFYKHLQLVFNDRLNNFKKAMTFLKQSGELVEINKDYSLLKKNLDSMLDKVGQPGNSPFTISDLSRICGISRKYSIPLAEYMDREGMTKRVGNFRHFH